MFLSHNDGKTTSTIQVNVGRDFVVAVILSVVGIGLVVSSLLDLPHWHPVALVVGVIMAGFGINLLAQTMALIRRAARTYDDATR